MKDNIKNYFERVSNNFINYAIKVKKISNAIDIIYESLNNKNKIIFVVTVVLHQTRSTWLQN